MPTGYLNNQIIYRRGCVSVMETERIIWPQHIDCTPIVPKRVATIKLCGGALTFHIDDTMQWQRPTDEQIYNLKNLFCIEVIPED